MPSASPAASLPRPQPPIGSPSTSTRCRERAQQGRGRMAVLQAQRTSLLAPAGPQSLPVHSSAPPNPVQTVEPERKLAFSIGRTCNVQTAWCAAGNGMG
ncbi:hypothetical protein CKAH01_08549 [Colletotrichum kahawae]|uniref:Uncharacterized protein n=1 Tax=Colletotrichum kahawae TaxID=34407 RepID=A0AAE0CZL5_COLKA|nr:hypothetical protein CKAH01_08549 [Colletotrichum kahawae]